MWYLQKVGKDGEQIPGPKHWLQGEDGPPRKIGRKSADILLKEASVSRTHATLTVEAKPAIRDYRSSHTTVKITDSSAYGTYVNYRVGVDANQRLFKGKPEELKEGACVAFGNPTTWYRLKYRRVVVYEGDTSEAARARIAANAAFAGFAVAEQHSEVVTHVLTEELRRSATLMTALVHGQNLVSPQWISAVTHVVRTNTESDLPDPGLYPPPAADELSSVSSTAFHPTPLRRTLLEKWRFSASPSVKEREAGLLNALKLAGADVQVAVTSAHNNDLLLAAFVGGANEAPRGVTKVSMVDIQDALLAADTAPLTRAAREATQKTPGGATGAHGVPDSDAETDHDTDTAGVKAANDDDGPAAVTPELEDGDAPGFKRRRASGDLGSTRETFETAVEVKVARQANMTELSKGPADAYDVRKFRKGHVPPAAPCIATRMEDGDVEKEHRERGSRGHVYGRQHEREKLLAVEVRVENVGDDH